MPNIKARCLEAQFPGDEIPADLGWAEFPQGPAGWIEVNGDPFNVCGFRWVTKTNTDPALAEEAYLELFLLSPENFNKDQLKRAAAQAGNSAQPGLVTAPAGALDVLKKGGTLTIGQPRKGN